MQYTDMIEKLKRQFSYNDSKASFPEHLSELRRTCIGFALVLFSATLLCCPFADRFTAALLKPAEPYIVRTETAAGTMSRGAIRLQFSGPTEPVTTWFTVSFFGGLLLSLPILIFIVATFVMPGIKQNERNTLIRFSCLSGFLFLVGAALGYKVTLPVVLGFMLKLGDRLGGESIWFFSKYIRFAVRILLAFGLAFQIPVLIPILGRAGILSTAQLCEKRRHVIVGILILSMLLTPPDVVSQLLMAVPLYLLFECSILILKISEKQKASAVESQLTS